MMGGSLSLVQELCRIWQIIELLTVTSGLVAASGTILIAGFWHLIPVWAAGDSTLGSFPPIHPSADREFPLIPEGGAPARTRRPTAPKKIAKT